MPSRRWTSLFNHFRLWQKPNSPPKKKKRKKEKKKSLGKASQSGPDHNASAAAGPQVWVAYNFIYFSKRRKRGVSPFRPIPGAEGLACAGAFSRARTAATVTVRGWFQIKGIIVLYCYRRLKKKNIKKINKNLQFSKAWACPLFPRNPGFTTTALFYLYHAGFKHHTKLMFFNVWNLVWLSVLTDIFFFMDHLLAGPETGLGSVDKRVFPLAIWLPLHGLQSIKNKWVSNNTQNANIKK